jgi:hypothetical protein
MANTTQTSAEILASEGQTIKPYGVYIVLRDQLTELGELARAESLRPQMMYNYDRNGLIVKGRAAKVTKEAGRYTTDEVRTFVQKWVKKNCKKDAFAPTEPPYNPFANIDEISAQLREENPTLIEV